MKIERNCKNCGITFLVKKDKQLCCSRRCFKQDYYRSKKRLNNFPSYKCPNCEKLSQLTFDPCKNPEEWNHFKCPWCYRPNIKMNIIITSIDTFIIF